MEWEAFQNQLSNNNISNYTHDSTNEEEKLDIPKCSDIYISSSNKNSLLIVK